MAVITISRQFGSGGTEIARSLSEKLGYRYVDKLLMNQVAGEIGLFDLELAEIPPEQLRVRGFIDRLLFPGPYSFAEFEVQPRDVDQPEGRRVLQLDESRCASLVRTAIMGAYDAGNAVIVGRGGQAVLGDKPGVFHVRVMAPLEDRIKRVQKERGMAHGPAQDMIRNHDDGAAHYLSSLFDVNWDDAELYNLIINTARTSIETAVEVVLAAVALVPVPAA